MQQSTGRRRYLEDATERYAGQLSTLRPAADPDGVIPYLSDHSIDFAMANKYRLGYVAAPLPGDQQFAGMLAIPYLSSAGVKALKFRDVGGRRSAKYTQHKGQQGRLYNSPAFQNAEHIIGVTEGELDALVATERLGLPSIGVPGATSWNSRHWKPLFKDFATVVILADGDEAGREFAGVLAEDLGWRAMIAQCPDGEDVSSMVAAGRGEELKALYSTSNKEN